MQLAGSISRFMYSTFPCRQGKPSHGLPSAMEIASSMSRKLLAALLGPEISALCPRRSTPAISSGGFSGGSFTSLSVTGSGKSASSSAYSSHSPHERLPMFVASSVCIVPPRTAPGIRLSREGFLLALSTGKPRASRKRNR